jgi:hypothetical protein
MAPSTQACRHETVGYCAYCHESGDAGRPARDAVTVDRSEPTATVPAAA